MWDLGGFSLKLRGPREFETGGLALCNPLLKPGLVAASWAQGCLKACRSAGLSVAERGAQIVAD